MFGGLYLNHLRYAVYRNLIAAENIADQLAAGPSGAGLRKVLRFLSGLELLGLASKRPRGMERG